MVLEGLQCLGAHLPVGQLAWVSNGVMRGFMFEVEGP